MKANPGGVLAPADVVGRDELIRAYWNALDSQSLVLSSVRRVGKTSIIKKMTAEPVDGFLTVYRDLEKVHSTLEFARTITQDVCDYLGKFKKTGKRITALLHDLRGMEIGGILKLPNAAAQHWKDLLTTAFEDLAEHQADTVVFFWDEVPMMLDNIRKPESELVAEEVLNTLRALRQTHSSIRMVLTGSYGLHCVISSLKRAGYANSPINDMAIEEVPPLDLDSARMLSQMLLWGEEIVTDDRDAVVETIVTQVDCMPYYIQLVVKELSRHGRTATPSSVETIVQDALTDPLDRWHMKHYRDRLDVYYDQSEQPLALAILDALATSEQPLRFDVLFNRVKAGIVARDREEALHVITLLQRDHYITLDSNGGCQIRFPLLRRWWRLHRGLLP